MPHLLPQPYSIPQPGSALCYDWKLSSFTLAHMHDYDMIDATDFQLQWQPWMDDDNSVSTNLELGLESFVDITVTTIDTVRSAFLIDLLMLQNRAVLCVGATGTGKTLTVARKLSSALPENYGTDWIAFSARSNVNQIQVRFIVFSSMANGGTQLCPV